MSNDRTLGWQRVAGGPRDLGLALGLAGRAAVHRHLTGHPLWAEVTAPRHAGRVARMAEATRARFPAIWAEIEGLAQGLDLPVAAAFAWNCRGDLLASTPDGCTTVMVPGETPVLAHNEDGLPFFRGACFIAEAAPQDGPGFHGFCYPGSIPGHTFGFNAAGLVQTVNNLRLTGVEAQIPRMVLGRAVLGCATLDQALAVLADAGSGGFHFALSHTGDRRILSVEFGGGQRSMREIAVESVHANHALHLPRGLAGQIVTQSSADRQARGDLLAAAGTAPLAILRDAAPQGLPIRRDAADDPDEENTLGTAVFTLSPGRLDWAIHDRAEGAPAYSGRA
ncbi:MAG: C45 family peptidase [Paracoccus aminovorans]|nr:C45 family peptidase [Paracoccus aminovorans]